MFCKLRGNPYVELVHWLQQILQPPDSDLHRIVRHFELESVAAGAGRHRGARSPAARRDVDLRSVLARREAVERGWVYATLMFGEPQVRTGHLVVGMLKTPLAAQCARRRSRASSRKINADTLTEQFAQDRHRLARGPAGAPTTARRWRAAPGEASDAMAPAQMGKQEALKRFATDLTEKARKGEIDPIVGRDEEIRQIVDILMRRRQNNPILTGEAGVGKTAVVEGFALRIAARRRAAAAEGRRAAARSTSACCRPAPA